MKREKLQDIEAVVWGNVPAMTYDEIRKIKQEQYREGRKHLLSRLESIWGS